MAVNEPDIEGDGIVPALIARARRLAAEDTGRSPLEVFGPALLADGGPHARLALAEVWFEREAFTEAAGEYQAVVDWARRASDPRVYSVAAHNLGACFRELGELAAARAWQQRSVAACCSEDTLDDRVQTMLGQVNDCILREDYVAAERLLGDCWAMSDAVEDVDTRADVLATRGIVAGLRGSLESAREHLQAALRLRRHSEKLRASGRDLLNLAEVLAAQGRWGLAARLLRVAVRRSAEAGMSRSTERAVERLEEAQRVLGSREHDPRWN